MRLEVSGATVDIDGHRIVHEAQLDVPAGQMVGLLGPNGSGKSTLLRCVYRVLRPVAGSVSLDGRDVWQMSARDVARQAAIVVQEPPLEFSFTVREMTLMGRGPHKGLLERDSMHDASLVDGALDRVGMAELAEREFSSLSGGEKQRVLIARALAQEGHVLILDEPTNHLDIRYQIDILELVRSLGVTTVTALHDLNLAAAYCDRVYLLSHGRVVAGGTPAEILRPDLLREVFGIHAVIGRHPVSERPHLFFSALEDPDPAGPVAPRATVGGQARIPALEPVVGRTIGMSGLDVRSGGPSRTA